ncbi:hypothetical protein [Paenibacillus macerans]|uniref:Phosphodiester glycosidase domain-containing protein n=1 Tax=Paenibacillus macerans TaxID=44252 RepID=A0A090ZMH3_PAEMA|nr:hypothetical protein [Paenibacillus macerans]KFN11578.1 hypothetical protein DJ90_3791 [Paenibacillus macerans]MCY7562058.1 hypothetical protein [Paenibacillus macerans]MEC0153559.1 hypothetical protein [Paenibacillus macerans]SUA86176.1 Uncharacterised protein [Paenibacillus macerans]
MAQATFVDGTKFSGIAGTVYYISADVRDVSVKSIAGTVKDSSYSGVNGTFFNSDGSLLGIALGPDGVAVRAGGDKTPKGYSRGTLFCYDPEDEPDNVTCSAHVVTKPSEYPGKTGWIRWAIGGLSLHLRSNFSSSDAYYDKLNSEESTSNIGDPSSSRERTFIGYKPSNKRIVMGILLDGEAWEVRTILKNLGCTEGVMLDSESSTSMKGKKGSSNTAITRGNTGTRVYNMVAVTPTSWA